MKEAYVGYEVAKLLKDKGFNIPSDTSYEDCLWQMYDEDGKVHWGIYSSDWYFRITQQMAMRWLRETHDIMIIPNRDKIVDVASEPFYDYFCTIIHNGNEYWVSSLDLPECQHYTEYEDVVEAALQYCLKNIIK